MRIIIDLQGCQSDGHRVRGIGRYSLSLIKSPGECGADVFVGEGQTLGNYINYGGPLLGLIAVKEKNYEQYQYIFLYIYI